MHASMRIIANRAAVTITTMIVYSVCTCTQYMWVHECTYGILCSLDALHFPSTMSSPTQGSAGVMAYGLTQSMVHPLLYMPP